MDNKINWDKLGEGFGDLGAKLNQPPNKEEVATLGKFSKVVEQICEDRNPSVEINLSYSLTGQEARDFNLMLALFKFAKARGELSDLSRKDYIKKVVMLGAHYHADVAKSISEYGKYMAKMLQQVVDDPELAQRNIKEALKEFKSE